MGDLIQRKAGKDAETANCAEFFGVHYLMKKNLAVIKIHNGSTIGHQ